MNLKKIFIFAIIIFLVAILGYRFINKKKKIETKRNLDEIITVETIKPRIGNIKETLSYSGDIHGINEVMLISQTSGIIISENFKIGDKCKKGQILFNIENELQNAGVEQAKAQLLAAETNYEKAEKDLKRTEKLLKDGAISQETYELSQLNLKSALSQLKGAQANLKLLEKQLADTKISSPINGVISNKFISEGNLVAPGTILATIIDDSKFKVKIMVSEKDIVKLKINQNVKITIDAIPNKEFIGKISSISLSPEKDSRSYSVEIHFDNSDESIKSGMFARCKIDSETKNNVMIIPKNALIEKENELTQVFIVQNNKAILKNVKIGLRNENEVEIISGINENDKVVIFGQQLLEDGLQVKEK